MNQYARQLGILKEKDDNYTGSDIRNGMTALRTAMTSGLLRLKLLTMLTGQHSSSGKNHLRLSSISGLRI